MDRLTLEHPESNGLMLSCVPTAGYSAVELHMKNEASFPAS